MSGASHMTDDKLIEAIGLALYGERWKAEVARDLAVSRDSVDDWSKGRMRPRTGVWLELEKIRKARAVALEKLAAPIGKAHAAAEARWKAR